MNKKEALTKAGNVLSEFDYTIPVDVSVIALRHGILLKRVDLEDEVSGMLILKDSSTVIAININHSITRQRFTIAHELGHYFLHRGPGKVFVDDKRVKFRDLQSSHGTSLEEIQANAFAAALLMPKTELVDYAQQMIDNDVDAEVAVWQLAERFKVSEEAMRRRLTNLGYEVE